MRGGCYGRRIGDGREEGQDVRMPEGDEAKEMGEIAWSLLGMPGSAGYGDTDWATKAFAASLTEKGLQAVELPSGRRQPLDSPVSPSKTQALSSAPRAAWCFRAAWPSRKGGQ